MSQETVKKLFGDVNLYTLNCDIGRLKKDETVVMVLDNITKKIFVSPISGTDEYFTVIESKDMSKYLKLIK